VAFFTLFQVFSDFRISGGPDFSVSGGSVFGIRGPKKRVQKPGKRSDFVKKGGLSIVTHFYIVRRFSGGVFLGWGSFGVWGKSRFSGFPRFLTPGTPPKNDQPQDPTPPSLYIYIYMGRENDRERDMGWVISGGGCFWVFRSVGSARSQLFMPGLHHAHTLQHPKKVCRRSPPGECFKNQLKQETKNF